MAGVPTEMTFNTISTVKLCQSIIVVTSQCDNTMRHDNALPVTCPSRCASHRNMHMSYRSKTYTWNDVILVKRSMIRVYLITFVFPEIATVIIIIIIIGPSLIGSFVCVFVCLFICAFALYSGAVSVILGLWLFCWHINNKELNGT